MHALVAAIAPPRDVLDEVCRVVDSRKKAPERSGARGFIRRLSGPITEATTVPYLERLVAALDEFRGKSRTAESVHLMEHLPESDPRDAFEVMERMPLG